MPPRKQWSSSDPRDAAFDRTFSVFALDELDAISGGHQSLVILLACPSGNVEPVIVDRICSIDPRVDARVLAHMAQGGDGDDRDRARNLRIRIALVRRDHGDCDLKLAIFYGPQLPARDHNAEKPTPEMVSRIRDELLNEQGLGGHHWKSALSVDELPAAPHERIILALVGLDSRGRIDDGLPRPSVHDLDQWMRRDIRQLAGAVMAHTMFTQTVRYCQERGLTLLWLWRWERPQRA